MKILFQPKASGIATVLLAALTMPPAWASDGIGAQAPSDLPETKAEPETPQLNVSGLPLSGRVFSDIYLPIKNLDTAGYLQSSASVWIQGDPKLGENGYARFILASDAVDANNVILGGSTAGLHTFLREAYAGYAKNGWDVRLGRQILPWGKTDVFNPTDFLSAKDFTFFNPDPEVQRIGATSLWLTWTPAQGSSPFNF